jgi:DNA modification methylase
MSYLFDMSTDTVNIKPTANGSRNKLFPDDEPAHDWYRFVLSFPPQLIREYVSRFGLTSKQCVLDPFCGTGTTLVECKKLGIRSLGLEGHPMAAFASKVKTDWSVPPEEIKENAQRISQNVKKSLKRNTQSLITLPEESYKLLLKNSISSLPLHKTLVLLEYLRQERKKSYYSHTLLALANALVKDIGNLHFGPEVGVGQIKEDVDVVQVWRSRLLTMASDIEILQDRSSVPSRVWRHDSRKMFAKFQPQSIDAVITSPPYPNEKDYTRTTRLESVLLGFLTNRKDLRKLKENLIRSNTRNVFISDDDDAWVEDFQTIHQIASKIEKRRIELGKNSGFEKLYPRVAKLYFGGMKRHFEELRKVLKPGATLAYVVGDQASYLRILIRTGTLLAEIAETLGYEVMGIDLFRTRRSTATREELREEVLLLRWPGKRK